MNRIDYIKPYSDNYMTYNFKEHRYVLTIDGANQSKLDMVLIWHGEEHLQDYLDLLSRTLYTVLLKNKSSKYKDRALWELSHSKEFRQSIFQMYMDVIWYNWNSGGFLTLYQSGVNLNEMKQLDFHIDRAFSVITNQMADNFGINRRVPKYVASRYKEFNTFEQLKDWLIDKEYFLIYELNHIDNLYDMPEYNGAFIGKNMFNNKYYIEDFNFWYDELEKKGIEW